MSLRRVLGAIAAPSDEITVFEGSLVDASRACDSLVLRGIRARLIELPIADHPEGMVGAPLTVYGRVRIRRQDAQQASRRAR